MKSDYKKLICTALQKDNVSLAEEYLQDMILDSYSGTSVAPDGYYYNRVITGYAQAGNHEKAKGVLKVMWEDYRHGNKQALPNKQCFTGIMKAWQNSDDKYHAPEACEEILREMYTLYDDTGTG
jgi:pentatricopeptide repeat protein